MGLTESASAEDTRTIIEGKLQEMDKDPAEVQVIGKDLEGNDYCVLRERKGCTLFGTTLIDDHITHAYNSMCTIAQYNNNY